MGVVVGLLFLINCAALAAMHYYFQRRLNGLESALFKAIDSGRRVYSVPAESVDISTPVEVPIEHDIVGAWAAECEARGVHVTEEEIAMQRRMWAAEGV